MIVILSLLLASCAVDDDDDCECAFANEHLTWISRPAAGQEATIGDTLAITVHAKSTSGVDTLGFVALGELAGIPVQLAHETAAGEGEGEATAQFEFVVPFNANFTRIVLMPLAEDGEGFLRAEANAITIVPYQP